MIPKRTASLPPPEVFRNKIARRIYEALDGERTIADILLHAHGSVYVVTKLLFELHRTNLIELAADPTAPEPEAIAAPLFPEFSDEPETEPVPSEGPDAFVTPEPISPEPVPDHSPAPRAASTRPEPSLSPEEVDTALQLARKFMSEGEFDAALEILDQIYRKNPNNESLRRLTREAEVAFMEKAAKHYMPDEKIPVLTRPVGELETEDLSPQEFFLLSRIDGTWDVRSIIQVAPIRDVEALRTLKKMREKGIIELRDPA